MLDFKVDEIIYIFTQAKRLKIDLASHYNQDIERLQKEQDALKAQIKSELTRLNKNKIQNETVSKANIFCILKKLSKSFYIII